jgi:GNAT superfamily N-acetyltransferase
MLTVQIRPATVSDAEALAVVHVRTWQAAYRGQVPQDYLDGLDPAERSKIWEERLRDDPQPGARLVLQHEAGGVIGFAIVSASRDPDADPQVVGEVMAIYVLPGHWGRGGGAMLMSAGLRRLAEAGFRAATLWVLDTNQQARRFYEAVGWQPDGAVKTDDSRGFPLRELRYRRDALTT